MHIESLKLKSFRNLAAVDLTLPATTILLSGKNAQGKTNLLEAVYLAATGRSFRFAAPADMVEHGEPRAHIGAVFVRQDVRHQIDVELSAAGRSLRVDGRGQRHLAALVGLVNVVAFFPDDLRITKGEPEQRRRFFDRVVASCRPQFLPAALAYARTLRSRNALLRQQAGRDLVHAYDEQLVLHGALVHRCRQEVLSLWAPFAAHRFAGLAAADEGLHIALMSGVPKATGDDIAEPLRAALTAAYPRDAARGMTTTGPHRADLLFTLGGREARTYASQGQQRSLVLALKLGEVDAVYSRTGDQPILLLDDVSSELDQERTALLFAQLTGKVGQVWVTTTGSTPLPLPHSAHLLTVDHGRVYAQADKTLVSVPSL